MDKPIIIIKAKKHIKPEQLDFWAHVFTRQMHEGVMTIPDFFEVTVVNPDDFISEITEIKGNNGKNKVGFFQKVFKRKNKDKILEETAEKEQLD